MSMWVGVSGAVSITHGAFSITNFYYTRSFSTEIFLFGGLKCIVPAETINSSPPAHSRLLGDFDSDCLPCEVGEKLGMPMIYTRTAN